MSNIDVGSGGVPELVVGFDNASFGTPEYEGDFRDVVVVIKDISGCVIPEPVTVILLGLGVLGVLRFRK